MRYVVVVIDLKLVAIERLSSEEIVTLVWCATKVIIFFMVFALTIFVDPERLESNDFGAFHRSCVRCA